MTTDNLTQGVPAAAEADASRSAPSTDANQSDEHDGGDNQSDADDASQAKKQPSREEQARHAMQKRIDRLYAENKELKRGSQGTEKPKTSTTELVEPKEEDFESDVDYYKALGKYEAKKEAADQKAENDRKEAETSERNRMAKIEKDFKKREADFIAKTPDYDLVTVSLQNAIEEADQRKPGVQIVANAIIEDENGPALAYHLGENPELLAKIFDMSPYAAIRALGAIDVSGSKAGDDDDAPANPQPRTPLPAPPTPVGARSRPSVDLNKVSPDEFRRIRLEQKRKQNL